MKNGNNANKVYVFMCQNEHPTLLIKEKGKSPQGPILPQGPKLTSIISWPLLHVILLPDQQARGDKIEEVRTTSFIYLLGVFPGE